MVLAGVLATALGCGGDRPPTAPEFSTGNPTPLTVTPQTLAFTIPSATPASLRVTVQYTGLITAASSNSGCATVAPQSVPAEKPPGSSVYVAIFTVTPVGVGSCTITMTDKKGNQVQVQVQVTVKIRRETLVAGLGHTCGLTSSGAAYCWGFNISGQLGDGTTTEQDTPTAVLGPGGGAALSFVSLTAGGDYTCGLISDGTAYCWGENATGQLGDGTTIERHTPTAVVGPGGGAALSFASLSAARHATGASVCGITGSGTAYCWGMNFWGELGDGTTTERHTPTVVVGPGGSAALSFASINAGSFHTCGLTGSGAAYCWGENDGGRLGDGTTEQRNTPTAVVGPGGGAALSFVSLAPSVLHTCGLTSAGAAYCWGENQSGNLGDGTTTNELTPTPVVGPGGGAALSFASISAGGLNSFTCGLTSSGTAYCWGDNLDGQLGTTTTAQSSTTPIAVTGPGGGAALSYASITTGAAHVCGLTGDGAAYCWGGNTSGQLGNGTTAPRQFAPTAVTGPGGGAALTFALP